MIGPVAVTGAGGYLGGRVVATLVREGVAVRPFTRHLAPWLPTDATELDLSVVATDSLASRFEGCAAVIHLAGANEVSTARDPDGAMASTLTAGRRVAAAARAAAVGRLVVLSTTHVYGAAARPGAVVGPTTVPAPRHPYAIARLAVEHLAAMEGTEDLVVFRLTNGVGAPVDPRVDRWTLVANDLCRQAANGPTIVLKTSGYQWRDFISLTDAVRAIIGGASGAVPAGTYDLGSGTPIRVLDLAQLVAEEAALRTGCAVRVEAPPHEGPVLEATTVDVSPLADMGFAATTPLRAAIAETLDACLAGTAP